MRVAPLFAAILLFGGGGLELFAAEPPQTLPNGLERNEDAKVALAYVRPGTDWTKYKTIQLKELVIPAEVRNAAPEGTRTGPGESYLLRDRDIAAIQKAYNEMTRKTLMQNGFTLVDTPQADTLVVAAQIDDIQLNAPIESSRLGYAGRGTTISQGAGTMAISAVLADGESGVVVGQAADRRYPSRVWGANNSADNLAEAQRAFIHWANLLSKRLKG